MHEHDSIEVHVHSLSADTVDAIRPLARRHGFRLSIADTVRFAVELAARLSRLANDEGTIDGLPADFAWPKGIREERRVQARQRDLFGPIPSRDPQGRYEFP
jgi:hypothetical protein